MPVDARRARRKRQGKADRLAASAQARLSGAIELRCPHCDSRRVRYDKTRGTADVYECGKCWRTFTVDNRRYARR